MVDKKTVAISVVLSVILSIGIIMTVPQVQEALRERSPRFGKKTFSINIGFDYGNGTVKRFNEKLGMWTLDISGGNGTVNWFNDTRIEIGDGIMQATLQVVDADYALWGSDGYIDFDLVRLGDLLSGEGGNWVFWAYTRHEDWPEFWPEEMPDQWYDLGSLGISIPLPDGFTCLWRWTP